MRKNLRFMLTLLAGLFAAGAIAQVSPEDGYYRIKNAYTRPDSKQYVHVTGKYKAQPNATHDEATTLPGTVVHLSVEPVTINGEQVYNVKTLRSQGVDVINGYLLPALDKVRTELKAKLKEKLGDAYGEIAYGVIENDVLDKWDLDMHIKPTATSDGRNACYAYATVPSMQPVVDFYKNYTTGFMGAIVGDRIKEAINNVSPALKTALDTGDPNLVWTAMEELALTYIENSSYAGTDMANLVKRYIDADRIHQGMTYYLIEGAIKKVDTNNTPYDPANPSGTAHNEYDPTEAKFDFANNNSDNYWGPELPAAGDAGMWILEKVDAENYFAVKPSARMKGLDGKYYTTLFTDFPFQIVGDVKAYTIEGVNEKDEEGRTFARVNSLGGQGTTVPAQTAVVLECPGTDVAGNQLLPIGNEEPVTSTNRLCGKFFETTIAGMEATDGAGNTYAVTADNIRAFNINTADTHNPMGFYKVQTTVTTVPGNKAFLVLTAEEMLSKGFYLRFEDGSVTAIESLENATPQKGNDAVYDLQGRRVYNPTHGLYIVNGKKVIIK